MADAADLFYESAGEGAGDDRIRARAIIRDIYARHGIDANTPLDEAVRLIRQNAQQDGVVPPGGMPAWDSPQARAQGRLEYASQGQTFDDAKRRWEESKYLLPPDSREFYQNYARDQDFLGGLVASEDRSAGDTSGLSSDDWVAWLSSFMGDPEGLHSGSRTRDVDLGRANLNRAVRYWDASNASPLYRKGAFEGSYARHGGIGNAALNAMTNPDLTTGSAMEALEAGIPNRIRFAAAGSDGVNDAAQADYRLRTANRIAQPVMILDPNGGAEPKSSRVERLIDEVKALEPPSIRDSVYRRTGFDIGQAGGALAEGITSALDGTQALGFLGGMKGGVRPALRAARGDTLFDAGTSAGISGAFAGAQADPEESFFSMGFREPKGHDKDYDVNAEPALRAQRAQQYRQSATGGVSTPDGDAYLELHKRFGRTPTGGFYSPNRP